MKQPFQVGDKVHYVGDFYDGRDARDGKVLGVKIHDDKYWHIQTTANTNWIHYRFYSKCRV